MIALDKIKSNLEAKIINNITNSRYNTKALPSRELESYSHLLNAIKYIENAGTDDDSSSGNANEGNATAANQQTIISRLFAVSNADVGVVSVNDIGIGNPGSQSATSDTGNFNLNQLFKRLLRDKLNLNLNQVVNAITESINSLLYSLPVDINEGMGDKFRTENYEHPLGTSQVNVGVYGTNGFVNFRTKNYKLVNCQYRIENCDEQNPITIRFDSTLEDKFNSTFWSDLNELEQERVYIKDGIYASRFDKLACPYVRLYVADSPGTARVSYTLFNGR